MKLTDIAEALEPEAGISRRDILGAAAKGAIALTALSMLPGCSGNGTSIGGGNGGGGITDADVLNFALNLEYLEAEFYTYATKGHGIQADGVAVSGTGNVAPTTGGVKTNFTDARLAAIAAEITFDEQQHVLYLRNALGAAAVGKPAINLAALGTFDTQEKFLVLARAFEDVGVSAYSGAAKLIQSKATLDVAARILATEALHSGDIRLQVAMKGVTSPAVDSQDVPPPPVGNSYFLTDSKGLAIERTTRAVLNIVYGGGSASGGFFPNGFNGVIKS